MCASLKGANMSGFVRNIWKFLPDSGAFLTPDIVRKAQPFPVRRPDRERHFLQPIGSPPFRIPEIPSDFHLAQIALIRKQAVKPVRKMSLLQRISRHHKTF